MLGKFEGKRRWQRRLRWLITGSITDSMDMNLGKLQEIAKDRETWHAPVHRVTQSQKRLSDWTATNKATLIINRFFQFSSVAQPCPALCNPMNRSTPGLPLHHQLLEFTQNHVHWVGDAIQPSCPLSSPSPPALNLSQWVTSSHQVAKRLEFQLQH